MMKEPGQQKIDPSKPTVILLGENHTDMALNLDIVKTFYDQLLKAGYTKDEIAITQRVMRYLILKK